MNLLDETIDMMLYIGKCRDDVDNVQDGTYSCSFDTFLSRANIDYDNGYGSAEINLSLKIVFNDGTWLERSEYDGAEGWVYCKCPTDVPYGRVDIRSS